MARANQFIAKPLPRPGRWLMVSLLWLPFALQVTACNALLGFDEGELSPDGTGLGTGTAGAGGSGGTSGSEDCLDRIDNDDDALSDCEDPDCESQFDCAPLTPLDWMGVGWLYVDGRPPLCSSGVVTELFDEADLQADSPTCECSCGDPTTECEAKLRCGDGCGAQLYSGWPGPECSALTVTPTLSCLVEFLTPSVGGACSASGSTTLPEVSWEPSAWLCLREDGGHCPGSDEMCIGSAESGAIGPCAARAGPHECPAAFPHRLEYADGSVKDARRCNGDDCSCSAPVTGECGCAGGSCGVEMWLSSDCTGNSLGMAPYPTSGQCFVLPAVSPPGEHDFGVRLVGMSMTPPAYCTPSGTVHPEGGVTATGTVTVCCAQDPG